MTWLLFKKSASQTWSWLRTHWQIPFLISWSILIWILARRNTEAIMEVIEAKKESHKRQVEVLKSSHRDELLKVGNLIKEYESSLSRVEDEFRKKEKKLSEAQKNEIKSVVIKSKGNTDEIKKRIEEEFGIKFV